MEQLKFHLLDCVAGQPCSQVMSVEWVGVYPYFFIYWPFVILNISSHLCVLRHLYPQAIPGDPDFSREEKDGEVKYEIITWSD